MTSWLPHPQLARLGVPRQRALRGSGRTATDSRLLHPLSRKVSPRPPRPARRGPRADASVHAASLEREYSKKLSEAAAKARLQAIKEAEDRVTSHKQTKCVRLAAAVERAADRGWSVAARWRRAS